MYVWMETRFIYIYIYIYICVCEVCEHEECVKWLGPGWALGHWGHGPGPCVNSMLALPPPPIFLIAHRLIILLFFWCLCALNFHIDLVFVTCCYYGISPLGAGAPRGSRALGARAHVERNDLHCCGGHFGPYVLMLLVSQCFGSSRWPCFCDFLLLWCFPYRGQCPIGAHSGRAEVL